MPKRSHNESIDEPRVRRRQPLRRCKKFRFHSNCQFSDLPEDIVRVILQFSQPYKEQARWMWLSKISTVCRIFYGISKELTPTELDTYGALKHLPKELWAPFLSSFLNVTWKGNKIKKFKFSHFLRCMCPLGRLGSECNCFQQVFESVGGVIRSLLTSPGTLPNLDFLFIHLRREDENSLLVKMDLLESIALTKRNLTKLTVDFPEAPAVSLSQFDSFFSKLNSLNKIALMAGFSTWMTIEHIETLLRHHGASLTHFRVLSCPDSVDSNAVLRAITMHCRVLEDLYLPGRFKNDTFFEFLRTKGSRLRCLGIRFQLGDSESSAGEEFIDALVQFCPRLEKHNVSCCEWFVDEMLDRIVRGQINRLGGRITLKRITVNRTKVTKEGARRVVEKDGAGDLAVVRVNPRAYNRHY